MSQVQFSSLIAAKTQISLKQVENTLQLLSEGATIPFISRYRKEMTGGLDEVQIDEIKQQESKFSEIEKRRQTILKTIEEQGKLSPELREKIENTWDFTQLEDIYLPYKPKRKTRAQAAIEKGLEPLAKILMKQWETDPHSRAAQFLNEQVPDEQTALQGGRDIIAEWVNENPVSRNKVRYHFSRFAIAKATLVKGKEEEAEKYRDYFSYEEKLSRIPSHRFLAIKRANNEGFLRFSISPPEEEVLADLERVFVKGNNESAQQVQIALKDSYKRLLQPSIETEFFNQSTEKAEDTAISIFAENLRQLLLAPPLGQKRILAIDPGYRTGCKLVCLDEQGNLIHNENIYPHQPQNEKLAAQKKLRTLVHQFKIDAISIGNGTASRETEDLVKKTAFDKPVQAFVVNEAGASVYSASPVAREEFPNYDVTVRGAVSIGRRLMDPLAELVKIDPKSIGVGQYQHDVNQQKLKQSLDRVVENCVNLVGVNLNTASHHLLTYVSGLGPQLAKNIVEYRKENGMFPSRDSLKKVPRLGEKAFEQCAGFLRIPGAKNPLDNSAVHPESYHIVKQMAKKLEVTIEELIGNKELLGQLTPQDFVTNEAGLPTINDIISELRKPGRDPRKAATVFEFDSRIKSIADLEPGMVLPGIVSNITAFGAFVDVGAKQDGLVHVSQLADRFVKDPNEVVRLNQHVTVKVIEVDQARKRVQLSMKL